ncbi:MAG: hypothetical protein IJW00_09060 [Clostridia bacterium]|nr:hypothetical protein [Clostridia bacterium]MBQ9781078.1 hypothetical protein [Clostridia bacterium]
MSEKTKKIIYLVYGILQSLLLLICGGCLIYACLAVYDSGNGIFSREAVTAQFDKIAIPVMLCLAGIVVGMILSLALPRGARKLKGLMAPADAIKRLSSRVDGAACPAELTSARIKEQNLRLILRILASAICVIVAIPCALYLFDLSHFDDIGAGLTEDIVAAMKVVLPSAAVGLSSWIVVTFACHFSLKRELDILKEAPKGAPAREKATAQANANSGHAVWVIRGVILVVALAFIVLGIINGGMEDVLQKAIRICTECIGLG